MKNCKPHPPEILFLVSSLKQSGPTRQLLYLTSGLDRQQFYARVLTLSPECAASMSADFAAADIMVESLNLNRVQGLLCSRQGVLDALHERSSCIVHGQGIRADLLLSRLPTSVHRATTVRANLRYDYPRKFGRTIGSVMSRIHYRALRSLDHVFCVSAEVKEDLARHGIRATIVYNGVDTSWYQPCSPTERRNLRAKLGIPQDATVFASVGALIVRKDPLSVINGFALASKGQNYRLVMLGDGILMDTCRKAASETPGVLLPGNVKDVRPWLQASDVYVSASTSEGLPNGVLEALSCGLPVCLSDIAGHSEILRVMPDAGALFRVGDIPSLSEAMRILAVMSPTLQPKALALARCHFSATAMAQSYQRFYADFLSA